MKKDGLKPYAVQTHVHGSGSEGLASYRAQDSEAAKAGFVDLVWWHEHEWRLVNFAKVRKYSFDSMSEFHEIANRKPHPGVPTMEKCMTWELEGDSNQSTVQISQDVVYEGTGSLEMKLPGGSEKECTYTFEVETKYQACPLFARPKVRLAIFPSEGVGELGEVRVKFQLSQQPHDLETAMLIYVLGGRLDSPEINENTAIIPCEWKQGEWNELEFDLAADIERLNVFGGIDNSMHTIKLGLTTKGPQVVAYIDSLEIDPGERGTSMLDKQREIIENLPMQLNHLVGMEVSYYGQHLNCFGSSVPVPDYEGHLPSSFSTQELVQHIRDHGGLACLNHPSVANIEETLSWLVENKGFGFEIMEVVHRDKWLAERLKLWDRLVENEIIVTGIASNDSHDASMGWKVPEEGGCCWINHIWAKSLDESDLLEGLSSGYVYLSNPSNFQGTIDIKGPKYSRMGDILVADKKTPSLTAQVTGLQEDDVVIWLVNGQIAHVVTVVEQEYLEEWTFPVPVDKLLAVRLQVHRPALINTYSGGMIALSNPLYLTDKPLETNRRLKHL